MPLRLIAALLLTPSLVSAQPSLGHHVTSPSMGLSGAVVSAPAPSWHERADASPIPGPMDGDSELSPPLAALACGQVTTARRLVEADPADRDALLALAVLAHRITWYDQAADTYARFAARWPADPRSRSAGRHAILLDLAVGRFDHAVEAAARYQVSHGRTAPEESAQVAVMVGEAMEGAPPDPQVRAALISHDRDWLARWGDRASAELTIPVQARLARNLELEGHRGEASDLRAAALAAWRRSGAIHATDAAASVLLTLADLERVAAEQTPPPVDPSPAALGAWLEARMSGLERALQAYERVGEAGVTVHLVAAWASVGEMWLELDSALAGATLPMELRHDARLLDLFRAATDHNQRLRRATVSFEQASRTAAQHRLFGPAARRALAGLRRAGLRSPGHTEGDELLGARRLSASGGARPSSVSLAAQVNCAR